MNKDLTVGKPESVLCKFCLPLFGSIIFQQLYNIADSFVAGKFIGLRLQYRLFRTCGAVVRRKAVQGSEKRRLYRSDLQYSALRDSDGSRNDLL